MWSDISLWLWFVFPWLLVVLAPFHVPIGHLYNFFGKNVYLGSFSCPFFRWMMMMIFFAMSCMTSLYILNINPISDTWFVNTLFHSIGCLFMLLCRSFLVWCSPIYLFLLLLLVLLVIISKKTTVKTNVKEIFPCFFLGFLLV